MKVIESENEFKIEKLYAYLSQDEKGNEGIVGSNFGELGFQVPLITSRKDVSENIHRPEADGIQKKTGKKIVFAIFERVSK